MHLSPTHSPRLGAIDWGSLLNTVGRAATTYANYQQSQDAASIAASNAQIAQAQAQAAQARQPVYTYQQSPTYITPAQAGYAQPAAPDYTSLILLAVGAIVLLTVLE